MVPRTGKLLGKEQEAENLIAEKRKIFTTNITDQEKLYGKKAYVTAGAAHGHALLAVLIGIKAVETASSDQYMAAIQKTLTLLPLIYVTIRKCV